jgi:hypothetical protein
MQKILEQKHNKASQDGFGHGTIPLWDGSRVHRRGIVSICCFHSVSLPLARCCLGGFQLDEGMVICGSD